MSLLFGMREEERGRGGGVGGIFKRFLVMCQSKWLIAGEKKKRKKRKRKNLKAFVLSNTPHPIKLINAKH
jgi:hypothetical protein